MKEPESITIWNIQRGTEAFGLFFSGLFVIFLAAHAQYAPTAHVTAAYAGAATLMILSLFWNTIMQRVSPFRGTVE